MLKFFYFNFPPDLEEARLEVRLLRREIEKRSGHVFLSHNFLIQPLLLLLLSMLLLMLMLIMMLMLMLMLMVSFRETRSKIQEEQLRAARMVNKLSGVGVRHHQPLPTLSLLCWKSSSA